MSEIKEEVKNVLDKVNAEADKLAATDTAKKFGMNRTVIFILGGVILLVVLSQVFGF